MDPVLIQRRGWLRRLMSRCHRSVAPEATVQTEFTDAELAEYWRRRADEIEIPELREAYGSLARSYAHLSGLGRSD
jgi:hypothetical protein